jgi:hypothetical protein
VNGKVFRWRTAHPATAPPEATRAGWRRRNLWRYYTYRSHERPTVLSKEAEAILALVSGFPSPQRERRNFMVMQACIDDSGSDALSPVFVLGGFMASVERWLAFTDEWKAALDEPLSIEYFKMSEAAALRGQFHRRRGWNESLRDERIALLTSIIRKYVAARISVALRYKDFAKYIRSIPTPNRGLASDTPYTLLSVLCIMATIHSGRRLGVNEKIDFIFDTQSGLEEEIGRMWQKVAIRLANGPVREAAALVGSKPICRDEKDFLPLQAADLYAWHLRKNRVNNRVLYMPTSGVLRTLDGIPNIERYYDEHSVRRMGQHMLATSRRIATAYPDMRFFEISDDRRTRKKVRKLRTTTE